MTHPGRGDEVPSMAARVDELKRVVGLLVNKMEDDFDVELDYQPGSVAYLDAVITELRREGRPLTPGLFLSMGGYVGETLVRQYEGRWTELDGSLAVTLDGAAHSATLKVFDWVKDAYADPHEDNLGGRVRSVLGDGVGDGYGNEEGAASA